MNSVAIIGAGALGQHIAHYLNQSPDYNIAGFYDDYQLKNQLVNDIPVLGPLSQIEQDFKESVFDSLLIGIGYNHMEFRQQLLTKFLPAIPFATYIHPTCFVDPSVEIGAGVIALPGCIFDKKVKIGNNIFFNIGCMLAHDTQVNDNCFFGPGVKVAGFVTIERNCFLGINATIINNISLEGNIRLGGGTVVTSNLVQEGLYVGAPAKRIK